MKSSLVLCMLLTWALGCFSQAFDTPWISVPVPDSTSHVWFRRTFLSQRRAQEAHIAVSTTGYFKLYVNECNIGEALFYPARAGQDDSPQTTTFDVTPFLRADTNIVAVLYSPAYPHLNSRQVAVSFYGSDADGQPFSYPSDGNWICRQANSRMTMDGGEIVDGRRHYPSWKANDFDPALWVGVVTRREKGWNSVVRLTPFSPIRRVVSRRAPESVEDTAGGTVCDFGQGFLGRVRLTLRNARRGERIWIDQTLYICNGSLDEQACPLFAVNPCRRAWVVGDARYNHEQITDIEGIATADGLPAAPW